jgi:hypothetical protein
MRDETTCPGCGVRLPDTGGAPSLHLGCSLACGRLFDTVLTREYSDPDYFLVHGLTVSSWRLQHPEGSARSLAVHLAQLCLHADGASPRRVAEAIQQVSERFRTPSGAAGLAPPASRGTITIADVAAATNAAEHGDRVHAWADTTWAAWRAHHAAVRSWLAPVDNARAVQ